MKIVKLKEISNQHEKEILSDKAVPSSAGIRKKYEKRLENDYRQAFAVDVDRILHSLAYTRYIDKTQVFYFAGNDHITHRVLHVQLVSKISRTIGRFIGLNEDLLEAIALGHDIGHPPFGHEGETFLSELCRKDNAGHFYHNVQSVRFLDRVERKGEGCNLCLQTLDGILCHDGEIHNQRLEPGKGRTFESLYNDIAKKLRGGRESLIPMTLEGCVVRMADTVSYIGRDIEDAIRLGLIMRSDLPKESVELLGDTNGTIVYTLVTDIIKKSYQQPFLSFSPEISEALKLLKRFNYSNIYLNPKIKKYSKSIKRLYEHLFEKYLADLSTKNLSSAIFTGFLENMSSEYVETSTDVEIVRDFIAGMTDRYFLNQCPESMRPEFVW
ncbi:MAG: HD domain-containing protein [Deltaproteobacteria bacterium]|nr:HD domain-containing protein [Deltaproteobacteria bacterium]